MLPLFATWSVWPGCAAEETPAGDGVPDFGVDLVITGDGDAADEASARVGLRASVNRAGTPRGIWWATVRVVSAEGEVTDLPRGEGVDNYYSAVTTGWSPSWTVEVEVRSEARTIGPFEAPSWYGAELSWPDDDALITWSPSGEDGVRVRLSGSLDAWVGGWWQTDGEDDGEQSIPVSTFNSPIYGATVYVDRYRDAVQGSDSASVILRRQMPLSEPE